MRDAFTRLCAVKLLTGETVSLEFDCFKTRESETAGNVLGVFGHTNTNFLHSLDFPLYPKIKFNLKVCFFDLFWSDGDPEYTPEADVQAS